MLQTGRNATARSICAHCALRSHLVVLRQKRQKQTSSGDKRHYASITYSSDKPVQFPPYLKSNKSSEPESFRIRKIGQQFINGKRVWNQELGSQRGKPKVFSDVLGPRLHAMEKELEHAPLLEQLAKEEDGDGERRPSRFKSVWSNFTTRIHSFSSLDHLLATKDQSSDSKSLNIHQDLLSAYTRGGLAALDGRIKYHFYGHITGSRFSKSDILNQQSVADLRYPTEWYPATRIVPRTIHLHVGPTNSGKTYHALQRLEKAKKGAYAGPLRLLAHEVFMRLNAKGRKCGLSTGEERRVSEGSDGTQEDDLMACTVEMMPLNTTLDVAVIDEIQMISNEDRGWAWTQALLGVKAKEVHLCGEERTVPLIRDICASVGEELVIHRYQRLSPLKVADSSIDGDFAKLQKGDCIVSFSVMGIHALRREIQKATRRNVAIVYGSLPPETRAQQARLFNDPDNDYDFLVASDAIGMGLNLSIKRVIFETSSKFNGYQHQTIGVADIKQIAGRAGRFRTAAQVNEKTLSEQQPVEGLSLPKPTAKAESVGIVTTLEDFDFPIISSAMASEPDAITAAGLQPPSAVLVRFASYFPPGTPFSFILNRLYELAKMHPRFYLCRVRDQVWIADLIEEVKELTIADRNIFIAAPASRTDIDLWKTLMPAYARCVATQSGGNIADIQELPLEVLEMKPRSSRDYLRKLERLHKGIVTYLWLSYRFAGIFTTRSLAFHVKEMVEKKIEEVLANFSFSEARRKQLATQREQQLLTELGMANGDAASSSQEDTSGPLSKDTSASDEDVVLDDATSISDNSNALPLDSGTAQGVRS